MKGAKSKGATKAKQRRRRSPRPHLLLRRAPPFLSWSAWRSRAAGARAAPLHCAPCGGGSSGARHATGSSLVGSCGAPPQPEPSPLSPDAAPFFPSVGRSKSMRWDEISLTGDEDERSPSPYLEAAHRALPQPASAGGPPTVDAASLHAARTGEIQASPGGADRWAGATSTDGADVTSPVRSFQVQERLAVVVRSSVLRRGERRRFFTFRRVLVRKMGVWLCFLLERVFLT